MRCDGGRDCRQKMRGTNSKKRGLSSRTGHRRVGSSLWLRKELKRKDDNNQKILSADANKQRTMNSNQCAACGKSDGPLKKCSACRYVWYCGVDCQRTHRPAHREKCKGIAKELKLIAALEEMQISTKTDRGESDDADPELFKTPPKINCAICLLPMSFDRPKWFRYRICCGKLICSACNYESARVDILVGVRQDRRKGQTSKVSLSACPFCRAKTGGSDEEEIAGLESRAHKKDEKALFQLAQYYRFGRCGLSKDVAKSLALEHKAAELGSADACYNLAKRYNPYSDSEFRPEDRENGITPSKEKMHYYYEEAAKRGDLRARYCLGLEAIRGNRRNYTLAIRHWMISVAQGHDNSFEALKMERHFGRITEEEYENIKDIYDNGKEEMKSKERDLVVRSGFHLPTYIQLHFDDEAKAKAKQIKK